MDGQTLQTYAKGAALVLSLLAVATSAHAVEICAKTSCTWSWSDASPSARYEIEIERELMPLYHMTTTRNWVTLPPPDRGAIRKVRLRVRRLPADTAGWSEWSDYAYGVPVGFDPDWDRDGYLTPDDAGIGRAQAEQWRWPRTP